MLFELDSNYFNSKNPENLGVALYQSYVAPIKISGFYKNILLYKQNKKNKRTETKKIGKRIKGRSHLTLLPLGPPGPSSPEGSPARQGQGCLQPLPPGRGVARMPA